MTKFFIAGIVREDDGRYSAYIPDVPSVRAGGLAITEAIQNASDGLFVALRSLAMEKQPIPAPSDMETVRRKVKEARRHENLCCPEDTHYQYIPAPDVNMTPVRISISMPKYLLAKIDRKSKSLGMSRGGALRAAAEAWLQEKA